MLENKKNKFTYFVYSHIKLTSLWKYVVCVPDQDWNQCGNIARSVIHVLTKVKRDLKLIEKAKAV